MANIKTFCFGRIVRMQWPGYVNRIGSDKNGKSKVVSVLN
jgi:hypothetical protein